MRRSWPITFPARKLPSESGKDVFDLDSFDYELPEFLIAQNPVEVRDRSRLMRLFRESGRTEHWVFSDLPRLLQRGDLLVLNDTRVFQARLRGKKEGTRSSVEVFCLSPVAPKGEGHFGSRWKALVRPGRRLPPGARVELFSGSGGTASSEPTIVTVGERMEDGVRIVFLPEGISSDELFARYGELPLPPYIKNSVAPFDRYQTVYSNGSHNRSVAAPTAGLHFTDELLERLAAMGVGHVFITLDVGVGTFRPVKVRDIRDHRMHSERCEISEEAAARINVARRSGGRIVAVGTTAVRTLESMAEESGTIRPGATETEIFIRPGYRFRAIDALITNFHLPRSTLLMLVSAFAGHDVVMRAYREAVAERYRFFSFGDAMLIG